MRRIYYTDIQRKKVRQEALERLREMRRNIDPAVLDRVREILAVREQGPSTSGEETCADHKMVPVDRKSVLMTIAKFIALKPDSRELHQQIKKLLASETVH